jgi:hypothetical protein
VGCPPNAGDRAALRRADGRPAAGPAPRSCRQSRLEVDQLRPRRGHDEGPCRRRANAPPPPSPPLARASSRRCRSPRDTRRDAIEYVQLGPTTDEQDLGRVHSVSIVRATVGFLRGGELRGVLRSAHDDLRAVTGEPDRDIAGCAVLGDVGLVSCQVGALAICRGSGRSRRVGRGSPRRSCAT